MESLDPADQKSEKNSYILNHFFWGGGACLGDTVDYIEKLESWHLGLVNDNQGVDTDNSIRNSCDVFIVFI